MQIDMGDVNNVFTYLDDINVLSTTVEEHFKVLEKVLHKSGEAGVKIKARKCNFFKKVIKFWVIRLLLMVLRCKKVR